ncbi:MAG: adenylate/guanylate cyclase domain-containing protein [Rhizobiaceae bacterium]
MTQWLQQLASVFASTATQAQDYSNPHTRAALERHKSQGMLLAFRARLIALAIIVLLLLIINPRLDTFYYVGFAFLFGLNGWFQLRSATIGRNRIEFLLLCFDLILVAVAILVPNPFHDTDWPLEMQYRFSGHTYFYIYLALGTLAFSPRTVRAFSVVGGVIWLIGVGLIWLLSNTHASSDIVTSALASYPIMAEILDPSSLRFDQRVQEIVIFATVAFILSLTTQRFSGLLFEHAAIERERTNLARYFSPNMVSQLSGNDEPLKQTKTQNVAVLFVDIVGFTTLASKQSPQEVISTLREFQGLMEKCVFEHHGTLDKFLGDGLMATFGTPIEGESDAQNCFACARSMAAAIKKWNTQRAEQGQQEIRIGVGVHYGPCVLGDIGGENRLEFAVIGDTVNIASRVEAKTRELGVEIAATQSLVDRIAAEAAAEAPDSLNNEFEKFEDQSIRGLSTAITLYGSRSLH